MSNSEKRLSIADQIRLVVPHKVEPPKTPSKPPHVLIRPDSKATAKVRSKWLLLTMSNMFHGEHGRHYLGLALPGSISVKLYGQGRGLLVLFEDDLDQAVDYLEYCFKNWPTIVRQFNLKLSNTFQLGVAANAGFCASILEMQETGATATPGNRAGSDEGKEDIHDWD